MTKGEVDSNKPVPPRSVPTVRQYVAALAGAESRITPKQRKMLEFHHKQPCLVTTATDLAFGVGYKHFGAANIQYGKLGSLIADELGIAYRGVYLLVLMARPMTGTNSEWLWVMRHKVARALEELGWVTGDQRDFFPWRTVADTAPN
jgi:hypothetical protein